MPRVPETFETARLRFRPPTEADAPVMFARYASVPAVTARLSWPRHTEVAQTLAFVHRARDTWAQAGLGPWLVFDRATGELLGSTGLEPNDDGTVTTGYLLVESAWGKGLASEILAAMVDQARAAGVPAVGACVHPDNAASVRVLEKAGLRRVDGPPTAWFPNLDATKPLPVLHYRLAL